MTAIANYVRQCNNLDFSAINRAALGYLPALLRQWLPDGRRQGGEWVALNPRRGDRCNRSFHFPCKPDFPALVV